MSWWIQRKVSDGKNHIWAIDVDPLAVIMLITILLSFAGPKIIHNPLSTLALVATIITTSGLMCLVISKFSLYRQGIWSSWGTKSMTKGNARLYVFGYSLIAIGTLLLIKLATIWK